MNDDIISLPNGDFKVIPRNPLRGMLETKFQFFNPINEYELERLYTHFTEQNTVIRVGDKWYFVLIESDSDDPEKQMPGWPGKTRKLCILTDRELDYYSEHFELLPDYSVTDKIFVIRRK